MKTSSLRVTFLVALFTTLLGLATAKSTETPIQSVGLERAPWLFRQADEIGANHRRWKTTVNEAGQNGQTAGLKTLSVEERGTGLNYWNGSAWAASEAAFTQAGNRFVANRVQHKTTLSSDLNVIGAVNLTTQDGVVLNSTPVGLALYDPGLGRFAVIASVTNSVGVLIKSNEVLYPDAFSGGVCADVVYRIEKGSFEQDVILTGRLDPLDYGFPTNAQLQVITEFYDAPVPQRLRRPLYVEKREEVRRRKVSPDMIDEVLGFGEFVMGTGRAFTSPTEMHTNGTQTVVAKEFKTIEGRTFLFETVNYLAVRSGLEALPPCEQGEGVAKRIRNSKATDGYAFIGKARPQLQAAKVISKPDVATISERRTGVTIDYVATIGGTINDPIIFKGDTTYLVSSTVYCNGPATIEGGAVIKYKYQQDHSIVFNNGVTCNTSAYRPAIFTAIDDDLVGDTLSGYAGYNSGVPYPINQGSGYANPAIRTSYVNTPALRNLRICYADQGLVLEGSTVDGSISDSQFYRCATALNLINPSYEGSWSDLASIRIVVNNVLFSQVQSIIRGVGLSEGYGESGPAQFFHCTFDNVSSFVRGDMVTEMLMENCILANIYSFGSGSFTGNKNAFYSCESSFGNALLLNSNPFKTAFSGEHYLAPNSLCRNAAEPHWAWTGEAAMRHKTTYAPLVVSNYTFSVNAELGPIAQRDTDQFDLGYHYDPIDYVFSAVAISNAVVNVRQGMVIGVAASTNSYGLFLGDGAELNCNGTATEPVKIVKIRTVQEKPWGAASGYAKDSVKTTTAGGATLPKARFRFTHWFDVGGDANHFRGFNGYATDTISFWGCEFYGGGFLTERSPVAITNCLFRDVAFKANDNSGGFAVDLRSSTFVGGTTTFLRSGGTTWTLRDNLFDHTDFSQTGTLDHDYNGYVTGSERLTPNAANDVVGSLTYDTGSLGNYYHAGNNFVNLGSISDSANAGLYHYTLKAAFVSGVQVKEANTRVDVGYHYVAFNNSSRPVDYDSDGVADYLEDANGDGSVSGDAVSWQSYNSSNGLSSGNGLLVFTPLKQ